MIPEAIIEIENTRMLQGYPIQLYAEISDDVVANHYEFSWDFGDGSTGIGLNIEHIYQDFGMYDVKLTISDETGSEFAVRTIELKASLELIASYALSVDEPSGLTFGLDQETLYTVSDRTGQIYQIDLSGNHLQTLSYNGGDLEGVSFDIRDSTLWIVDESSATLIHLDTTGVILRSQWIAGVSDGSGLEGIALDSENSRIFLLKEKNFGALLMLNDSLETVSYERIVFAPDFSGMYYSRADDELWVLSDEASSIYQIDTSGTPMNTYGILLEQPEGIAVDEFNHIFYIVDDALEKLYKYKYWDDE